MSKIKVKHGKFTHKSWVVNEKGKRITDKFYLYEKYRYGDFVRLNTSNGEYLYHKKAGGILETGKQNGLYLKDITSNLVAVERFVDGEWTLRIYNMEGELLLDNVDSVMHIKNGLIPICIEGKWGFMDENLKLVIPPLWQKVSNFNEKGCAIVKFKDLKRFAIINKKGEYICPPCEGSYYNIEFLTDELLKTTNGRSLFKYGVITNKGKVVLEAIYDSIWLIEGYIKVRNGEHFGLFDTEGNEIFECIYPEIIETDKKFIVHDFAKKEILKTKEYEK